jgi:hypothetical protein
MLLRRRISKCGVLKLHYGILEDGKPEHNLGTEKIRYIDIHLFDCPMISNIEEKILNHLSVVAYDNGDIVIHCHQHWHYDSTTIYGRPRNIDLDYVQSRFPNCFIECYDSMINY